MAPSEHVNDEWNVLRKAISDVAVGRAMVFKAEKSEHIEGLRISPLGVVGNKIARDHRFDLQKTAERRWRGFKEVDDWT